MTHVFIATIARARLASALVAAACLALLASAGCGSGTTARGVHAEHAKWTFLVYLNAANDLQPFAPLNVNQMEQVGSTRDMNIVVEWKQATGCGGNGCGNPTWTGTRRYYVTKDVDTNTVSSQVVQDLGQNVDMGSWRSLHDFVAWGQQTYPADHYAVVIWNHGAGWLNVRSENTIGSRVVPRAVSIDDKTDTEIETWELPQALDVTPKLDMVVFDASLMQMLEVAYEIRSATPIVVGSEESPPGEGYPYHTFLTDLAANPAMTSQQLGSAIVGRTFDFYQTTTFPGQGQRHDITQSMLDTSKLDALADRVNAFGAALLAHSADNSGSAVAARQARSTAQSYAYPENKDLWDYADIVKHGTSASDLKAAASDVQQEIAAAVLAEKHDASLSGSHGIASYVPAPLSYVSSYGNLALSHNEPKWPQWLQGQPQ